ncbi:hypothetical protein EMIHUDRAFT_244355 [Emiliania huxleyi CCMP1516]|uniref:STI1/HOP DP domain-containing protein n=2 Tax=Emiliania huxleyi TaxID=2903 RepID=A0A0D3J0X1_EMIH1|nr:hypothetical protein EMIHUDRAFT_244355 [Emiliania huxleyi CCMP1516]EOD17156.1 hypothetical protein EMIHUDRAFT_244355 [Emiliania huxleyi CCMP1516]|eukprot:XP_005769585.1 hypothetical protein EMIHUDRAFT_244355 [Emiliania huxleyi CCMP1516]
MLADTPADDPHGEAAPAEEEEEPIVYDGPLPADIAGTPFAIFRAVDIWERLASHPDTRPHVADSGFRAAVERLRALDGQAAAREVMEDPRLAQALMAMQGGKDRLKLREEDMLQAEVGGRMKRRTQRDPVQLPHLERAHGHATAAAAKEAGNAHFKAGEYPDAAACYARALSLAADGGGGAAARETSYMYELGFPQRHFGATEPWAEAIKTEAAELFHAASGVVGEWVEAFKAKATAVEL